MEELDGIDPAGVPDAGPVERSQEARPNTLPQLMTGACRRRWRPGQVQCPNKPEGIGP